MFVSTMLLMIVACRSARAPKLGEIRPNREGILTTPASAPIATPATSAMPAAVPAPAVSSTPPPLATTGRFGVPVTRRDESVVDDLHGTKVADPYRWLEDPDSPETRAWVEAQNRATFGFLTRIPEREAIRQRLAELWNYERESLPVFEGGRSFWTRNDGLLNQDVLWVSDGPGSVARALLDPNKLEADGTAALGNWSVSRDGRRLAYSIARSGSDWVEWRIRDVTTGQDLPDRIEWSKFSKAAWTKDGAGFFYSRYDAPKGDAVSNRLVVANSFHKLWYHRVGSAASEDRLVYERPDDPDFYVGGEVSDDGRWLQVSVRKGTSPRGFVFVKDLEDPASAFRELVGSVPAGYQVLGNRGSTFWVQTDEGAPRGRVVRIDLERPAKSEWLTVIPESPDALQGVSWLAGDRLVAAYLKDASSQVRLFDLAGASVGSLTLPSIGAVAGFDGKQDDVETYYTFSSYTAPPTIRRWNLRSGEDRIYRQPKVAFDPSLFETELVFATSRDGTKIPLFLSHRKGLVPNKAVPTYLYGYGGFNQSMTPRFRPAFLSFMERGGVVAVACLRGGEEYGEEWHLAGTKLRKQNVFDDFIASAQWLVASGWTVPAKLAIAGGSNGGLLVGAVLNQRPDLFGAALPAVGVMDMLRFHKFTVGWGWISDYGSPDDPAEFRALLAYSPLHNVRAGTKFPAVMATTADHDDRVVPAHSYKWIAAMQAAQGGEAPVLIRIDVKAGHGAGKPTSKRIDEVADELAFLTEALGISRTPPK